MRAYTEVTHDFLAAQRMLVIAPHADDEAFGCAGTIARIKALGGEVYVVVVSVGDLNHYDGREGLVTASTRAAELEAAMRFLAVDDYDILYRSSEVHERIDTLPRRELIEKFERDGRLAMDKVKPTLVAIPAISYNQDHEAVFRAALTACRPGVPSWKHFQPIVLSYDNTALFWSLEREKFHPNLYVDISEFLDTKIEALRMHRSQMRPSIHHSSPENVRNLALTRGREISTEAAEGYMVLRMVL
ncbi:MAG: PIG-L family deacetylase [Candidatus Omnitrophica bacterium]|nr:PIG-L family deacetylase [Candidatus Omnitrophota bacterium]